MKIIAIPDLHGKDCWKQIDPARFDKVIFIGDYVDAKDGKTREVIIQNLTSILAFKNQFPEKVVLLLGNHDIQYLHYPDHRCSGFDADIQSQLTRIFNENKSEFQIAWQRGNHLFVHAGVSRRYFAWLGAMVDEKMKYDGEMSIAHYLNRLHESKPNLVCVCGATRGGLYPYGGPLWADITETRFDHLDGYHQIVGHSRVLDMHTSTRPGDNDSSITYIDVLSQRVEFFEIEVD
jgi:predicted phosphodiesterase